MSIDNKKRNGFTLIELLVVISIIGVLSTIAMTSLSSVRAKARDARRRSDMDAISLAMEQYYSQYGTYRLSGAGYSGSGSGWFTYENAADRYPKSMARALVDAGYFKQNMRDPQSTSDNGYPRYMLYVCGSGFYVYCTLEAPSARDTATYTSAACRPGYGMNYAVGHSS